MAVALAIIALAPAAIAAADTGAGTKRFDLPPGDAEKALREFSAQSGVQVLFSTDTAAGVKTNAVKGHYTPRDAMQRLLEGTRLIVNEKNGVLMIGRKPAAANSTSEKSHPAEAPRGAADRSRDSQKKNGTETQQTQEPMKRKRNELLAKLTATLAFLLAPVTPADAQTVPNGGSTASSAAKPEQVVELSPFVVNTSKDVGYQANATLSGSRTNTELKDLANPIDVMTKEFMDDLAVRDIQDLTLFATGVEPNAAGDNNAVGQQREIWNHNYMHIRGFLTGTATRNFMELLTTFDTYNSERVEFSKGPNSILFGTGNPGGSSNYSTKIPLFHRSFRSLQWGVDDEGTHRVTGDLNQVLLRDKLAVRLNLLHQEREFYRVPSYHDERAAHLVATYKPFKNTTVTVGHEYRDTKRALPRGIFPANALTNYLDAGSPAVTSVPASGNNLQINGTSSVTAASQGLRIYGNTWVLSDGVVRNVRRTATTANYSVNGVGGNSLYDPRVGYPDNRVVGGPNGLADTEWRITEADITQRIGENFNVSFAFARSESFKRQTNTYDNVLKLDPNNFGGNAHFGEYYVETNPFRIDIDNEITDVRATASYELDLTKFNRWFGAHQIGAMLERNEREEVWDHGRYVVVETPDGPVNFASYGSNRLQNASARLNIRDYLDFSRGIYSGSDLRSLIYSDRISVGGHVAEMRRNTAFAAKKDLTRQDAALAVLHSRWWDGRFVTTVGVRDDRREFRTAAFENNPDTFERRPVELVAGAPAGSHDPRHAKLPDRPEVIGGVSRNYGAVFHLRNWLSLTASYATNFSPGTQSLNLFGQRVPHSTGESKDFGLRLNLLGGRVSVSLITYETSEIGTITDGNSVNSPYARLYTMEDILLENGVTAANPTIPVGRFTTSDRVAKGQELVMVGSPTPSWNFRLSATRNDNRLTNIAPEVKAFFAGREALYAQHVDRLALSGVGNTIGEHLEQARTSLGLLGTRENVQQFPASEYTARLTAKYSFDRSPLLKIKGFSAGGNFRWSSAPVIGYYKNANATFDVNREYKGEADKKLDMFFIYERRLTDRINWRVQLNIDNVFDDTDSLPVWAVNNVDGPDFQWVVTRLRPVDGRAIRITNTISF